MNEERLGRIETMLADLIRIVGSTNAMVEETRDDLRKLDVKVSGLEDKVDRLEDKVDRLEGKVDQLEGKVIALEIKMNALDGKVDVLQEEVVYIRANMATREDIQQINWRLDVHMEKLARQEEDIYRLKRLVGVK